MEPLERKVARFVQDNNLFAGAERILLSVSGGADSIALLHVMHRLTADGAIEAELLCTHLHHGLRGTAADSDKAFVVQQVGQLNLPIVTDALNVKTHARKHRLSIETAARQQRLATLAEIARMHHCPSIATGHQKDDNAETLVQRIERGTGFRGLAGIWPSRQADTGLTLVRPLLCCSRREIVTYLTAKDLSWREDHTNADCTYTRNHIRHRLLPLLQGEADNSLVEALAGLAAAARRFHCRVAAEAMAAAREHARFSCDEAAVDAPELAGLAEPVAVELLRQLLTGLGLGERDLTRHHYRNLLALAGRRCTRRRLNLPNGFSAQQESGRLLLRRPPPPNQEVPSPVELCVPGTTRLGSVCIDAQVLNATQVKPDTIRSKKDPLLEYIDFDRIGLPLIVRTRRPGDRFIPLGQRNAKKIGKFLTAARMPQDCRARLLVIEDAEKIFWVCPVRISETVKVTETTRSILELRVTQT